MIKVNYNAETGKVISFGKDTEPFIEITEQERRQPLPDRYSYYAVDDGRFVIKRRTPTDEEIKRDKTQAINKEIQDLKQQLAATDYQAIKYAEGWLTEEEYLPIKVKRSTWRARINELEQNG